jgi:hypothetical protein
MNLHGFVPPLLTIAAAAAHFDDRPLGRETGGCGGGTNAFGKAVIIDMNRRAAIIANQENAVMQATGMAVGQKGIGAFDPPDQIVGNEQVKDPVNAIGRYTPTARQADAVGDIIGAGGFVERGNSGKNLRAHFGPLFAARFERSLCRGSQGIAAGFDMPMIMLAHGLTV